MSRIAFAWREQPAERFGFVIKGEEDMLLSELRGLMEQQLGDLGSFCFLSGEVPVATPQEEIVRASALEDPVLLHRFGSAQEKAYFFPVRPQSPTREVASPGLTRQQSLRMVNFEQHEDDSHSEDVPLLPHIVEPNESDLVDRLEEGVERGTVPLSITVINFDGKKIKFTDIDSLLLYANKWLKRETRPGSIWIDVEGDMPDADSIKVLANAFGILPLTMEDCLSSQEFRQKMEPFEKYLFIAMNSLHHTRNAIDVLNPINILLLEQSMVITFHKYPSYAIQIAQFRLFKIHRYKYGYKRKIDSLDIVHAIVDSIGDTDLPVVQSVIDEIKTLEDFVYILGSSEQEDLMQRMGMTRRNIVFFRQKLWPKRDILQHVCTPEFIPFLRDRHMAYFRDVYDHFVSMIQSLEMSNDLLASIEASYLAKISINLAKASQESNVVMKIFSSVATIILPLTFVSGLFGMNVKVPWQTSDSLVPFSMIVIFMLFLGICLGFLFRFLKWM